MIQKLGIYIHLPFCVSKCAYCDFYSVTQGEPLMEDYQKALLSHIKTMATAGQGYVVDTIYFGGGTPTLYGAPRIDGLLRSIKKAFRVEREAEITVEANPDSLTPKGVQQLKKAGVNRISLGMQSAHPAELENVGRPHTPQQTREAVAVIKGHHIPDLSLDLIFGLPGQSVATWATTLEEAIALEPQHISCYGRKVEEGTPLHTRVAQGEQLPDDDDQADLYLWTVERLRLAGYPQYEISNFAQPGHHARHNMGYWQGKPYLGFGASASSDFGGYRYTLAPDITQYCHCVLQGGQQIFSSNQLMSPRERREEYLMLRLRTTQGVTHQDYEKACGLDFAPIAQELTSFATQGWAESLSPGRWQFTPQGFLRSNQLIGRLLEVQETSGQPAPPPILAESPGNTGAEPAPAPQIRPEIPADNPESAPEPGAIPLTEDDFGQFQLY